MFKRFFTLCLGCFGVAGAQVVGTGLTTAPAGPPTAPLTSRLYAGAHTAFGETGAYGMVIGSTQVFGHFGAQATVEYSAKTGAMLVNALLTWRPQLRAGRLQPYGGLGLGLSSSEPQYGSSGSVTDYTAQALLGSDYLLTSDIALYGEASYRHAFSDKGKANGSGALGRLGVKFFF